MRKNYKFKDWQIKLINNFSKYELQKLTWKQIAIEVDASWTAVETFVRRNKSLFEKETLNQKWNALVEEMDNYNDRIDGFEAKATNKPVEIVDTNIPKILIWDIETSLLKTEANLFSLWQQNISIDELKGLGQYVVLSWSAKWLHNDEIMSDVVTSDEILADDDRRVVQSLFNLLDECDIAVAHFGDAFDVKMMNARFMYHDMKLPSPYRTIDTCTAAKAAFKLPSYKLDYLGKSLGEGQKHKMVKDDWIQCLRGNTAALEKMRLYNCEDVFLLQRVYLKLRPYIKHPNVGVYMNVDKHVCPACGSDDITWDAIKYTDISAYNTFQCNSCGSHGRSRTSIIPKEKRSKLTISVPK